MAGKKRTRTGEFKDASPQPIQSTTPSTTDTLPQPLLTSNKSISTVQKPRSNPTHQKLPKLPPNTTTHPRPLLHAPLPLPTSSSLSPKTLYLRTSTPLIPAIKRIRNLLTAIKTRAAQSAATARRGGKVLEASGRLAAGDVERGIVEGVGSGGGQARDGDRDGGRGRGEKVYVKATGRAIRRALEIGVYFQGEDDVVVRVEMGSVKAVDDIVGGEGGNDGDDDDDGGGDGDVPETRVRNVSSVTVSIGLA